MKVRVLLAAETDVDEREPEFREILEKYGHEGLRVLVTGFCVARAAIVADDIMLYAVRRPDLSEALLAEGFEVL
jgi:hypothetical protein